jgi:hypothetical protein
MELCKYGCPCLGQQAAPLGGLPSKTRSGAEMKAPEYQNSIIIARFYEITKQKQTKWTIIMELCNYGCPCLGQQAAPLGGLPSKTRSGAEMKAPEYHNYIIMVRFLEITH